MEGWRRTFFSSSLSMFIHIESPPSSPCGICVVPYRIGSISKCKKPSIFLKPIRSPFFFLLLLGITIWVGVVLQHGLSIYFKRDDMYICVLSLFAFPRKEGMSDWALSPDPVDRPSKPRSITEHAVIIIDLKLEREICVLNVYIFSHSDKPLFVFFFQNRLRERQTLGSQTNINGSTEWNDAEKSAAARSWPGSGEILLSSSTHSSWVSFCAARPPTKKGSDEGAWKRDRSRVLWLLCTCFSTPSLSLLIGLSRPNS